MLDAPIEYVLPDRFYLDVNEKRKPTELQTRIDCLHQAALIPLARSVRDL